MINYQNLLDWMKDSKLAPWVNSLPKQIEAGLSIKRYGDLPGWYKALHNLPQAQAHTLDFKTQVRIGEASEIPPETKNNIEKELRALIPWRKGPYSIFGIYLDTEWHSDWKWDRVISHISPLENKLVLDVGCGNGYHCWRMYGEGAQRVIGIDPSPRFVVQFYMLKKLLGAAKQVLPVDILPVGIEALPEKLEAFDTTFSMGVFYHRRSPMDHLKELMDTLKPGGELILETLVIKGLPGDCLVPEDRYAKMNNVWFIPSVPTLLSWMKKTGFENAHCVNVNTTSIEEQRTTEWMRFQSLADFLHHYNPTLTVEGHPAPTRAVIIAQKPMA